MPTIFDLVTSSNTVAYYDENMRNRQPYIGETLFPDEQQLGLRLEWIKGAQGLPVVLKNSAFDTNVIPRGRKGFDVLSTKMPYFKESMYVDEELRQQLNILLQTGNQSMIDMVMNRIFKDTTTLLDAARAAREMMRMSLVTTGVLSLSSNGQAYSYDFGIPSANKITVTNKWSTPASSTPMKDLREAMDLVEDATGVRPTRAIMSRKTWYELLASDEIKKSIYVFTNGVGTISDERLKAYLIDQLDLSVEVVTKKYINTAGASTPYVPDGIVSLLPSGILGNTWFGTTPEESDLMGVPGADTSITDTGVAVTAMRSFDPVNVETKVSMICLPSFEQADKVAILSVD